MLGRFLYKLLQQGSKFFSAPNQVSLGLSIVHHALSKMDSLGGYKIRRRIFDRFFKSYPMLYSHEALRVHGFMNLIASLKNTPGDFVECGVGRGRFFTVFVYANAFYNLTRKVYGFDSFEGFPIASKNDFGTRVSKQEKISGWDNVKPEMIYYVLENDIDCEGSRSVLNDVSKDVFLIKGYFNETLLQNLPDKIAFLHLDADLYESTRDALQHCLPRMSKGSIIVFDELHEKEKWPGVAKAVDEICTPRNLVPEWDALLQRFVMRVN